MSGDPPALCDAILKEAAVRKCRHLHIDIGNEARLAFLSAGLGYVGHESSNTRTYFLEWTHKISLLSLLKIFYILEAVSLYRICRLFPY